MRYERDMNAPIEIAVQASPTTAGSWSDLARTLEHEGFRALVVADHPGTGPAPFPSLAAAAAATTRLRLGTYVVNAGVRDPVTLAADVATVDLLSEGRAELGIGAGHTPAEWEMLGWHRPSAPERIRTLIDTTVAVRALLAGEIVPAGTRGSLVDLRLDEVSPLQQPVPVLVGGGNRELLRWAGATADAVGFSGLGRTLPDGHRHEVRWSVGAVDAQVALVRDGAVSAGRASPPPIDALVQHVELTDDPRSVAAPLAERIGAEVDDVLDVPYVWIGSVPEISDRLIQARERWGITRWTVREPALDAARQVLRHLGG